MWWGPAVQIGLLAVIFSQLQAASIFDQTSKGKCQPIEIPLCKEVPYNYTYFPNPYLQQDQQSVSSPQHLFYIFLLLLSSVMILSLPGTESTSLS
ncbi:hypothetical protein OSTOST_08484 [Ostertagia ostertagi]